ncbi:hypothetical protein [Rhizobium leguminosarum]|uniref:hypothetical protein n=1 Tax=Rhizobium leguminosarum TaxID=384 RepID=UPI001FDEB64B|nr:hypothetical protein [Rhizobium leguminosarum]
MRPVVNLNLSPAPKRGFFSKCIKERKLALIAKGRLRELLAEKGLRIVLSGAVDAIASADIYRTNGEEIGKKLLQVDVGISASRQLWTSMESSPIECENPARRRLGFLARQRIK